MTTRTNERRAWELALEAFHDAYGVYPAHEHGAYAGVFETSDRLPGAWTTPDVYDRLSRPLDAEARAAFDGLPSPPERNERNRP